MAIKPQYVVDGLVKRGIPRAAALGFAGNFVAESNLDPGINEIKPLVPGSRGGFGLAQWTGPRRKQLEAFAGTRGKPVSDPEVQMDFLAWELQNTEKKAAQSIFSATDPTEAARLISEWFLRPGIPNMNKRLSATAEIAGGTFQGGAGGGDDVMVGGSADDDLDIDFEAFGASPQEPAAPDAPAIPSSTLAEDYAASGALDEIQLDDLTIDLSGFTPMATPQGIDAATGQPMDIMLPRAYDPTHATPPQPTDEGGVMRGLGLGARNVAEGLAGTVGIAYDPIAWTMNAALGTDIAPLRDQVSSLLTQAGVPEPQGITERILAAIQQGAAGSIGAVGASRAVGGAIGKALASGPVAQTLGGAGAGAGAQTAAEMGAGPVGQAAAGLAGAVVGAAPTAIRRPQMSPTAAQDVAQAERAGITPMTTDVFPPDTFIGRSAQRIGELVPIAGTGPARAAQQAARVQAVRDLAKTFGADAEASDDVMRALISKRGDDINKYATLKNDVITSIPGPVSVPNTLQAIDDQIANLRSLNTAEVQPVIAKLEDWRRAVDGQDLQNIEVLRKQFGEAFTDPSLAGVRSTGQKALSSIYGALRKDMGDHIKANGQPRDFTKWSVANKRLSEMMGELDNASLKSALAKGDVTPERIRSLLFSSKPSDVRTLYKNLPPEGRARARSAVLYQALEKASDGEKLSPQKFRSQLVKMGGQIGVFFGSDDLKAVEGLRRVLDMTSRAGDERTFLPTGGQLVPYAGGAAATYFGGGLVGGAAVTLGTGLSARAMESKPVRNMLMKLATTAPNSKEEAAMVKRIMEAARAATQEGEE